MWVYCGLDPARERPADWQEPQQISDSKSFVFLDRAVPGGVREAPAGAKPASGTIRWAVRVHAVLVHFFLL